MRILGILGIFVMMQSCTQESDKTNVFGAASLHFANRALTEISMEDIYSPPVATRVFAYPNLAAYEVFQHGQG